MRRASPDIDSIGTRASQYGRLFALSQLGGSGAPAGG